MKGFTLIELSIVLVILGLIVGAIVGGQSLVHQSELRSVITNLDAYRTAINAFQLQYDDLPGDFDEATQYWPGEADDGDGNGYVTSEAAYEEQIYVWRHLMLADIISGQYTGDFSGGNYVLGVNVPASKVKGGGYTLTSIPSSIDSVPLIAGIYGKQGLFLGLAAPYLPSPEDQMVGPVLVPKDAASLDKKVDDGDPSTGSFLAVNGGASTDCTDNAITDPSASYELGTTEIACMAGYKLQ